MAKKAEQQDAVVSRQDESVRAGIEAQRGIVRDGNGAIVRSNEWRSERINYLKNRKADFTVRAENCDSEIAEHQKALKKSK